MATINSLLSALDERTIAQRIGIPNDEARMRYHLRSNTVEDFDQFSAVIADYYNHHHTICISNGGSLSPSEAYGRAKELLERDYKKRRGGDIVSAFNDAHDGTNGGMRVVLDVIAEGLKAGVVERYISDAFDRHVAPNSWEQKVDMICQFIAWGGNILSVSVDASQPERYAQNYSELIKVYVQGLQQTSSIFRRL
jgi:hypothetical protein